MTDAAFSMPAPPAIPSLSRLRRLSRALGSVPLAARTFLRPNIFASMLLWRRPMGFLLIRSDFIRSNVNNQLSSFALIDEMTASTRTIVSKIWTYREGVQKITPPSCIAGLLKNSPGDIFGNHFCIPQCLNELVWLYWVNLLLSFHRHLGSFLWVVCGGCAGSFKHWGMFRKP